MGNEYIKKKASQKWKASHKQCPFCDSKRIAVIQDDSNLPGEFAFENLEEFVSYEVACFCCDETWVTLHRIDTIPGGFGTYENYRSPAYDGITEEAKNMIIEDGSIINQEKRKKKWVTF